MAFVYAIPTPGPFPAISMAGIQQAREGELSERDSNS